MSDFDLFFFLRGKKSFFFFALLGAFFPIFCFLKKARRLRHTRFGTRGMSSSSWNRSESLVRSSCNFLGLGKKEEAFWLNSLSATRSAICPRLRFEIRKRRRQSSGALSETSINICLWRKCDVRNCAASLISGQASTRHWRRGLMARSPPLSMKCPLFLIIFIKSHEL